MGPAFLAAPHMGIVRMRRFAAPMRVCGCSKRYSFTGILGTRYAVGAQAIPLVCVLKFRRLLGQELPSELFSSCWTNANHLHLFRRLNIRPQ